MPSTFKIQHKVGEKLQFSSTPADWLISQQVSQKRLKLKVIPPLYFEFQKLMASAKTFSILKYIVLGLPKKNFRSIRAWQHPSTSADISTQGLGGNFAICRFSTYKHHHELPVNGGILIYVSHLVLWRPSWEALPGGQREGGRGEAQHDHGEHHQYYLWHLFKSAITQGIQISIFEDDL